MKYMTQKQIDEIHYVPANNVFTAFMVYGPSADMTSDANELHRSVIASGESPVFATALRQWYIESCALVLKQMCAGQKPTHDYPRFVFKG